MWPPQEEGWQGGECFHADTSDTSETSCGILNNVSLQLKGVLVAAPDGVLRRLQIQVLNRSLDLTQILEHTRILFF
jgi:hypothetical protein